MNFQKITHGFVLQKFDQLGECIGQSFTAGDEVDYETEDGDAINVMDMPLGGDEYQPFDMVQPTGPHFVEIHWGSKQTRDDNPVDGKCRYEFNTSDELEAFMKGCDEMDGWTAYLVIASSFEGYVGEEDDD